MRRAHHEILLTMRLDDVANSYTERLRRTQIHLDVAAGIDHRRVTPIRDHVGVMGNGGGFDAS